MTTTNNVPTAPTAIVRFLNSLNGTSVEVRVSYHWEDNFGQGGFWRPWFNMPAHKVWARLFGGNSNKLELTLEFITFTDGFAAILMKGSYEAEREIIILRSWSTKRYDNWPTAGALMDGDESKAFPPLDPLAGLYEEAPIEE